MAYKQNPKSPIAKALVGNQNKLPQHLQDAIKAAPESPAKMYGDSPAKQTMDPKAKKGRRDASGKLSVKQDPSKLKGKEKEEFIKNYAEPKKSPAKQTVGPKPKKKVRSGEELTGKKATKTFKKEPIGPYKPVPKSPAKNYKKGYYGV